MKATQQLKDEHEGIKLMLKIMEKISIAIEQGKEPNVAHYERIVDFLKGFADKCHHGKEEDILFPELEKHGIPNEGGPVGVMLSEHRKGREYIKALADALEDLKAGNKNAAKGIVEASAGYVQLLRNHIEKENNVLFMMADKVLDEKEQSEIYEAFERLEIEKIGAGKHEEYHKLLKELKDAYL
ncbi:hemerythrin domain-containing protein [uncultured Acetobacteroides sp.]|uniref:hemerythrin domain-containing protein n=1 Tax=uncultured Acetobacteroides sp. TaxID=1760811 RepID=UPI0029F5076F|nr:hemerythrin domain-containing protein [uncultured Acetobacteroides sp.]